MHSIQVQHLIPTGPEAIFRLYADVRLWSEWDPDTRQASLDGPFVVGSRGRLLPTEGRAVPMVLTAVTPNRSFTVECRIPGFKMVFDHELRPVAGGTEVTHRATFSGWLAPVLGRMLVARLRTGLPRTLASLSEHAQRAERN